MSVQREAACLRCASDHILDVVSVPGAVNVSVMPLVSLVLHCSQNLLANEILSAL